SDIKSIQKYSLEFRKMLFNQVLIEEFPLLTIQVVSDLAYREFRTGNPSFSGWLEIYKELAEALNMDSKRLDCYTMLGGVYRYRGFIDEAYEYYNKALVIASKIGNKEFTASLLSNMADLEHTKGNLEKAEELCLTALSDPEISESKPSLYVNLAEVLIKKENYEEALKYLKKANEITNNQSAIVSLFCGYALTKTPGKDNFHEGIKFLEKGGLISEKTKNQRFLTIYYYLMGRVYLDSYDLSSAINSFEKCYSLAIMTEFQYVLLSQLYLAESYLHRYKISQLETDLSNSERYLANVITICQEQDLPILAEILFISAQILITLSEFVDASTVLNQAKELAEIHENYNLQKECEECLRRIQTGETKTFAKSITDITAVIESLSKKAYLKKTEHLPKTYFLSIFTNDGVRIYSYSFDEDLKINETLVSGLISAISNMSSEFFDSGLRGIDFEGKKILVESFGKFIGILVCDRDSFNARTKLYDYVRRFSKKYEDYEVSFSGDELLLHIQEEAEQMTTVIFSRIIKL
ncbi:MAG: tetratricopeptide repeat protein, partial [Candidatus Heimdallarchaeaceae archaeon]